MASIKIVLRQDKLNALDKAPLYLRFIQNRKTRYVAMGQYIEPRHWNAKECKVRKSHPNSVRMNALIAEKLSEGERMTLDLERTGSSIRSKEFKKRISGKSFEHFFVYAQDYLDYLEKTGKVGTYRRAKAVVNKFRKFSGAELLFEEITVSYLKQYDEYLRVELGNAINTVNANFRLIRRIINNAVAEDIITVHHNAFLKYKLTSEPTTREFLNDEELLRLEGLTLKRGSNLDHHRNLYVFAAYAAGIRISDLLQLQWKNFDGSKLHIKTGKTGEQLSVLLPQKALEILKLYEKGEAGPDDFIFPLLKIAPDEQDAKRRFNAISSATTYVNKDLRTLMGKAQINKHVSFHSSRHSWATRALKKGMRIEYVSKLLTHRSINTTQIYARIIDTELDNAMELFNE